MELRKLFPRFTVALLVVAVFLLRERSILDPADLPRLVKSPPGNRAVLGFGAERSLTFHNWPVNRGTLNYGTVLNFYYCPIWACAGTASTTIIAAIIKVLISMVPYRQETHRKLTFKLRQICRRDFQNRVWMGGFGLQKPDYLPNDILYVCPRISLYTRGAP